MDLRYNEKNVQQNNIVMFYNYFTFPFYRLNPKKTIQQHILPNGFVLNFTYIINPFFPESAAKLLLSVQLPKLSEINLRYGNQSTRWPNR